MTTEDIIKDLRYLCELPAYAGVSETMTLAANAIEGLGLRFDECMQIRNDACAEIKRLEQELSDSTNYYNGIINRLRSDINERSDKLEGQEEISRNLYYERGLLKAEVEHLKNQSISNGLNNHLPDTGKMVRPEPSRLEIAAMIFAGGTEQTITDAFLAAEELIEHARKTE
jgi:transcription initiation factor TFIID subunit TAF12